MTEIHIHDSESIENALRRFKRKVQQEDIIKEVKKHSFYMKPGEKKRVIPKLDVAGSIPSPAFRINNLVLTLLRKLRCEWDTRDNSSLISFILLVTSRMECQRAPLAFGTSLFT
jgi:small subunit ribosomal protein S21